MKNKPLYFKIWIYFSVVITIICVITAGIIFYWTDYYYEHSLMEKLYKSEDITDSLPMTEIQSGTIIESSDNQNKTIEASILKQAQKQENKKEIYTDTISGKDVMYAVEIEESSGERQYKYSIISNIYKDILPQIILTGSMLIIFILIVSFIIIRVICKQMTRGISEVSDYTNKISFENLNEKIKINSNDKDILGLVNSFENMRERLATSDKEQQSMFQYISHELKTPVMIINSYLEAAKDKVYPKGDLNSTYDVISNQSKRIQVKVEELLYLASLTANNKTKIYERVNLQEVAKYVCDNYAVALSKFDFIVDINNDLSIQGDSSKIRVLFENMIENQIRYAKNKISIIAVSEEDKVMISFYNDGEKPVIENDNDIFQPFAKGKKGRYGLGLNICKRISEYHNGTIKLENSDKGCAFVIGFINRNV